MHETTFLTWLRDHIAVRSEQLPVGIGDDAAVLRNFGGDLIVTTDLICDGVHFRSDQITPWQVGRKAMAVNLSDIAAMAARPVAAFVSLLLPYEMPTNQVIEIMKGASDMASTFQCPIAGGDTNIWRGKLGVNVVVLGQTLHGHALRRDGAKPGDAILVTGALGGSLQGHHLSFTPRIEEALTLHRRYALSAGMDLSDGLAIDLRRMCAASGCGADVEADRLPISDAAQRLAASRQDQVRHAIGDGEDFELLLAAVPDAADRMVAEQPLAVPISQIGVFVDGDAICLIEDAHRKPMPELGYEHGRSP